MYIMNNSIAIQVLRHFFFFFANQQSLLEHDSKNFQKIHYQNEKVFKRIC